MNARQKTVSPKALRIARTYLGADSEFQKDGQDKAGTVALAMLLDSFAKDAVAEFQKNTSKQNLEMVRNRHA